MALRDVLGLGKPAKPDLDGLDALTAAAPELRAVGLRATGVGSLCVKQVEGGTIDGNDKFEKSTDEFGFAWLTRRTDSDDVAGLIADLHELAAAGEEAGFGGSLVCALVPFDDGRGSKVAMIYRFGRGTWYPFVPSGPGQRDNERELD